MVHWRSITSRSVARKKLLQMTILSMMRAMRAVLYSAYQVRSPPYRDLLTDQDSPKPR